MIKILRILYDINTLEIVTVVEATDGYTLVPDPTIGVIQCDVEVTSKTDEEIKNALKEKVCAAIDNFSAAFWL